MTGSTGNDIFNFVSATDLGAATTIAGGAGTDTIQMTAAANLTDANFAHATSIEMLGLTGAGTVTLDTAASSAGITKVITGIGNTTINDTGIAGLTVDASTLGSANSLTLTGNKAETITITGNLAAGTDTGALTVTVGGLSVETITTGSGADHITANNAGDTITGGGGTDSLTGGTGNDVFNFASEVDLKAAATISGGAGTDTIR